VGEFDDATHFEQVGPVAGGQLRYAGQIAPGWDIAGNANGGYLLGIAARAMADAVGRPPLSVTAHYLAPGRPGPAEVLVDVHRSGRRLATAGAVLRAASGEIVRVLGTFGAQREEGPVIVAPPADMPPLDGCVPFGPPSDIAGIADRLNLYAHPDDAGFRDGRPSGRAEIRGWFEFADNRPADAIGLLLAADAFPPVLFAQGSVPLAWTPTVELTVHIRGVPAPGPLRCRFSSRFVQGGMCEEDGELWDTYGTLVAQSRQLALIPRPG